MTNLSKPKFITFEGGEGSGKSTQSKMLYEYLISKGMKAIHTREIGGTVEAEKIRNLLVYSDLYSLSELMLVMAARFEHINKVIIPALLDGSSVICDRFIDSTACYQSEDSGLNMQEIYDLHAKMMRDIHDYETTGIMPDMTFFMDVPPDIGLKRAEDRGDANKFEDKNIAFHHLVYERFKSIVAMNKERVISINCQDQSPEQVHKMVVDSVFY